jgi:hypothetical protein
MRTHVLFIAAASDKVYQLLAHGRWFSPGAPASSTTKTGRHDIAELLLKVALITKHQSYQSCLIYVICGCLRIVVSNTYCVFVLFFIVLCALYCQFRWIVPLFWLPLRHSLTFIYHNMILTLSILALYIYNCLDQMRYWSNKQTYTCSLFFLQIFVFLIVVTSLKFPIFF